MKLNILYCSDNNYAPYCGTSIFSLFKNNVEAEAIDVYVIENGISSDNIQKLKQLAKPFGETRKIIVINGRELSKKMDDLGTNAYRGSQTANLRLVFSEFIPENVDRLVYLDCDTIVVGNIEQLFSINMLGRAIAAVPDSLTSEFKQYIGFKKEDMYFNSGVLLIDTKEWKKQNYDQRLRDLIKSYKDVVCFYDQDFLNLTFKNQVYQLPLEYNFQTTHIAFKDKYFFKNWNNRNCYEEKDVVSARKNLKIIHAYRFLGQFSWTKHTRHPAKKYFLEYYEQTPFKDYPKPKSHGLLFRIERIVYTLLPQRIFTKLFIRFQVRHFKKSMKRRV